MCTIHTKIIMAINSAAITSQNNIKIYIIQSRIM